jgi:hypothetical protein
MFAPKPGAPKPAPAIKPASTLSDEARSAGEGIRARMLNEDAALKALGSMKSGGTVPKTGPYILHEGEKVVPKKQANGMKNEKSGKPKEDAKKEVMKKATAGLGGDKKKKHRLHMHIRPVEDGRFTVDHEYRGGQEPMPESTTHAPQDIQELLDHVKRHYSEEMDEAKNDEE